MRHRKAGHKLNRTRSHRTAMLRNLAASLFEHGQVTTTVPKAKAVQPFVEKIITKAKKGDLHSRRQVIAMLGRDRRAFDWLYDGPLADDEERDRVEELRSRAEEFFEVPDSSEVERNRYGDLRKAPKLVKHIFENVAPRFEDRAGGYTRIVRIGYNRLGDAAEVCVIQFVGAEEGPEISSNVGSTRRRLANKRAAFYEGLAKEAGVGQAEASSATATAEPEEAEAEAGASAPEQPEAPSDESGEESQEDKS